MVLSIYNGLFQVEIPKDPTQECHPTGSFCCVPILLHVFVRLSLLFLYFVPLVTEKVVFASKNWFWPANGVWSTRSLVKTHNSYERILLQQWACLTYKFYFFIFRMTKPIHWKCNGMFCVLIQSFQVINFKVFNWKCVNSAFIRKQSTGACFKILGETLLLALIIQLYEFFKQSFNVVNNI